MKGDEGHLAFLGSIINNMKTGNSIEIITEWKSYMTEFRFQPFQERAGVETNRISTKFVSVVIPHHERQVMDLG